MKKILLTLALCIAHCALSTANIHLPEILSDHMVLQQNSEVNLWGTAEAGNSIDVYATWGAHASAVADKDGKWMLTLSTPAASYAPQSLTFVETPRKRQYYAPDPVKLEDVLIGEVWLGSGQSNMEMPLMGFWQCPIQKSNEVIATAGKHAGHIRMVNVEHRAALDKQEEAYGSWKECNAFNAPNFSATAYFFAEMLEQVINVPVGIINCSWGGSRVEGWMPREILSQYKELDLSEKGILKDIDQEYLRPLIMYNGMLYPIRHYTIKGFLWYQGCSSIGLGTEYGDRCATMLRHWRELWGQGELPFYFAEIAPFRHGDADADWAAVQRESQWHMMDLVPNVNGVSTNDLVYPYEIDNVHPSQKQEVGYRLAYLALHHDYHFWSIYSDHPQLERYEIVGNEVRCYFTNASDGFSRWADIEGFEVIDAEGKAHKGQVRQVQDVSHAMAVYSDEVAQPKAVRYCFHNFQLGNVANARYLPIVPFRTDSPYKK